MKQSFDPGPLNLLFHEISNEIFINSRVRFCVPEFELISDLLEGNVDFVLISNPYNMLALPFFTEYTKFQGKIYATEPTLQIGRQFMEELVEFMEASNMPDNPLWQKEEIMSTMPPTFLQQFGGSIKWKRLYTKDDVENCISKVTGVSYGQEIHVTSSMKLVPYSSGFCLGSAN